MNISVSQHNHWVRLVMKGENQAPATFDGDGLKAFRDALDRLDALPDLRCVVIESASCDGACLSALGQATEDDVREYATLFLAVLQKIHDFRTPVIFWARGLQQGGALGLMAACDIILGDKTSFFSLPEVTAGMAPILISQWLIRRIGAAQFRRLALSAVVLNPEEALRMKLIDDIYGGPGFPPAYARILRSSPQSTAKIKRLSQFTPTSSLMEEFVSFAHTPANRADFALLAAGESPEWRKKKTHGSRS
jgi:methylglutaconyl-CoA hydratase